MTDEQHLFECYCRYIRDKLKSEPKHVRESVYKRLTKRRTDQAKVRTQVFKIWSEK